MGKVTSPEQWAKDHKKAFVDKMLEPYLSTADEFHFAIFMAGLPGAGKTEFTKELLRELKPKPLRLDMDEIAAQIDSYKPQIADKYRKGATILLENTFSATIKKKVSFVMDGTFGGPKALQNIVRALKRGYYVKVVYLCQDPRTAWKFTQAREKVEHRAINIDGFVDSYFNVLQNLRTLLEAKLDNVTIDIAIKNESNKIGTYLIGVGRPVLDEVVKQDYNKNSLKGYIDE